MPGDETGSVTISICGAAATGAGAGATGCGAGTGATGCGAGAGWAVMAGAGAAASPGPTMTASGVPTATVSPAGTRISSKTPAAGDGTSVSTLSVETSRRISSSATESPACLAQRRMVPSVTVSPNWGIVTVTAIGCLLYVAKSVRTAEAIPRTSARVMD